MEKLIQGNAAPTGMGLDRSYLCGKDRFIDWALATIRQSGEDPETGTDNLPDVSRKRRSSG
ncbi:MAG: hypothetical protein CVU57_01180 [Deltaproteobacteria bacterium HGW-Deltaproteobacteria-15]|nr:MAG: hypothetical protein CVU57_01180 [Deltaproteobacteria bacterium HGW-Deltaproteobacteria-15]